MFFGEYQHNLDAKGRLTLPAEFRDELGSVVYVTKGFEGCLSVYTEKEFLEILTRISGLKESNHEARVYSRIMSRNSKKLELDKMGRINLSNTLIEIGGLKKSCIILGAINRVEIWDEDTWNKYYDENEADFEEIAEKAFKDEG